MDDAPEAYLFDIKRPPLVRKHLNCGLTVTCTGGVLPAGNRVPIQPERGEFSLGLALLCRLEQLLRQPCWSTVQLPTRAGRRSFMRSTSTRCQRLRARTHAGAFPTVERVIVYQTQCARCWSHLSSAIKYSSLTDEERHAFGAVDRQTHVTYRYRSPCSSVKPTGNPGTHRRRAVVVDYNAYLRSRMAKLARARAAT